MNNKKIMLLMCMIAFLAIALFPLVSATSVFGSYNMDIPREIPPAFFTDEHTYWTAQSVANDPGIIHDKCADKIQLVVDGNFGADIFVVHYTDSNNVLSYINTHTRLGVDSCFTYASNDGDLQCWCYGMLLHNVQDHYAHVGLQNVEVQGLVPKYIASKFSSNLVGHMTIEQSFDEQFQAKYNLKNNAQHQQYISDLMTTTLLDPNVDPAQNKYLTLMSQIQGSTLTRQQILDDANLITNGFKGTGFYNTVYQTKEVLPLKYEIYSLIPAAIALILLFSFIYLPAFFGKKTTKWKYLVYAILIIIAVLSILLFISFFTGTTWDAIQVAVKVVPIKVAPADINYYDNLVSQATTQAVLTGQLPAGFDDNSGLTYVKDGVTHVGALNSSEMVFWDIGVPIILFLGLYLFGWLIFKMFRQKPIVTKGLKIFNAIGYIILGIVIVGVLWLLFNFFVFK